MAKKGKPRGRKCGRSHAGGTKRSGELLEEAAQVSKKVMEETISEAEQAVTEALAQLAKLADDNNDTSSVWFKRPPLSRLEGRVENAHPNDDNDTSGGVEEGTVSSVTRDRKELPEELMGGVDVASIEYAMSAIKKVGGRRRRRKPAISRVQKIALSDYVSLIEEQRRAEEATESLTAAREATKRTIEAHERLEFAQGLLRDSKREFKQRGMLMDPTELKAMEENIEGG